MKSTIRLFRALPIATKKKRKNTEVLAETIRRGFVFSPDVLGNYTDKELLDLTGDIGLTPEQMNNSFHKSWKKIKEASIEQLVLEQIIHYITTYGFEHFGIYSEESVYIPNEKLEVPGVGDISLVVIKGYTKQELKEKLLKMISGIALGEDTIKDILDVALFVGIDEGDIDKIKNKEVSAALYDYFNLVPKNPIEFLRYVIFKTTGKTLLIKSKEAIEEIKEANHLGITRLFENYDLDKLAEIFYRFKPIFLAFRTNKPLKKTINRVRKLAVKRHKPMPEDFLNTITAKIKRGEKIDKSKLEKELERVNIFRKIRLAYALKFRMSSPESIMYRIRNGKAYSTDFDFSGDAKSVFEIVLDSIVKSLDVKGKKIYIPDYVEYALPTTEKQFTGYFPSGSYIIVPQDIIFGVHWNNVKGSRIDLDLSLIDMNGNKVGWDADYRSDDRKILFSGDMTDAQSGASELFYIGRQLKLSAIMVVNYYNHEEEIEVPFDILVANERPSNFGNNYMVNPNNVLGTAKTKISQKQKLLGLLIATTGSCRFYFCETSLGGSITSSSSDFAQNARKFLVNYYENSLKLRDVLKAAGAKLVEKENCEIDLSPEKLEKDSIINLLNKS